MSQLERNSSPGTITCLSLLLSLCFTFPACNQLPQEDQDRDPTLDTRGIQSLAITNLRVPEPHVATSGQIRPEQMDALPKAGFALVISLRPENESGTGWEESLALESGLSFVRLPVADVEGLSHANVQRLAWLLASVPRERFVLVYCNSGNRAGALLALKKAWVDGMDHDQALVYARKAGATKLMSVMQALLDT